MNDNNNLIQKPNLKLAVFGESVGKTSIINRFIKNKFELNYEPFSNENQIITQISIDGVSCNLEIYNVHPNFFDSYSKNVNAFMLVYSIIDEKSFDTIEEWYNNKIKKIQNVCCILVGNKLDLSNKRKVEKNKAEEFAKNNGMTFLEISAKDNINIKEAFLRICHDKLENENQSKKELGIFEKLCGC